MSHQVSERARKLHFTSLIVDSHADTTQRLLDPGFDLGVRSPDGSIDIPRMKEGGLGAIFFSIWVPGKITGPEAVKRAFEQIEVVQEQVRRHSMDLELARAASDVFRTHSRGKIAVLLGLEGGHMIDSNLSILRNFAAIGVRYLTLTHMRNTDWADSSTDRPVHNGLTTFGKEAIREMNRLGMMVDVSHVSDETFHDALEVSGAPLIASHSSCRALCETPRNLTDAMMKAIAAGGGVIQINFHVGFLSQEFRDAEAAHPEWEEAIAAEIQKRCGENDARRLIKGDEIVREYMARGDLPTVDWTKIVEHIDYAVKVAGIEHVGLGSDFDGANMPFGMEDATHLPQITEALLEKGYPEGDIRKILGENLLRVMEETENISRKLNAAKK
jgi:membrane dipeptidase